MRFAPFMAMKLTARDLDEITPWNLRHHVYEELGMSENHFDQTKPLRYRGADGARVRIEGPLAKYRVISERGSVVVMEYNQMVELLENVPEPRKPVEFRYQPDQDSIIAHLPSPDCRHHGCKRLIEWPEGAPLPDLP